jgi:hypothetical protein
VGRRHLCPGQTDHERRAAEVFVDGCDDAESYVGTAGCFDDREWVTGSVGGEALRFRGSVCLTARQGTRPCDDHRASENECLETDRDAGDWACPSTSTLRRGVLARPTAEDVARPDDPSSTSAVRCRSCPPSDLGSSYVRVSAFCGDWRTGMGCGCGVFCWGERRSDHQHAHDCGREFRASTASHPDCQAEGRRGHDHSRAHDYSPDPGRDACRAWIDAGAVLAAEGGQVDPCCRVSTTDVGDAKQAATRAAGGLPTPSRPGGDDAAMAIFGGLSLLGQICLDLCGRRRTSGRVSLQHRERREDGVVEDVAAFPPFEFLVLAPSERLLSRETGMCPLQGSR